LSVQARILTSLALVLSSGSVIRSAIRSAALPATNGVRGKEIEIKFSPPTIWRPRMLWKSAPPLQPVEVKVVPKAVELMASSPTRPGEFASALQDTLADKILLFVIQF
jgi:hypothetical protein